MNRNSKYASAACGGLMIGVGVPTLIASLKQPVALVISIAMIAAGGLLAFSSKSSSLGATYVKVLLSIHVLLAVTILAATLAFKPHAFLTGWSVTIIILAVLSWRWLTKEASA